MIIWRTLVNTVFILALTTACKADALIKICFENWPPYYSINESGKAEGVVAELIQSILDDAGLEVQFFNKPPIRCQAELRSGKMDMGLTAEAADDGILLGGTALTYWVIAATVPLNHPGNRFHGLEAYRGKRALLISGYDYPAAVRDFQPHWKTEEVEYAAGLEEAAAITPYRMLETGRADLILEDLYWSEYVIEKYELKLKTLRPPAAVVRGYAGYSLQRDDLRTLVEQKLAMMAANGELSDLYKDITGISWESLDNQLPAN